MDAKVVIKIVGGDGEPRLFESESSLTTNPDTDWSIFDFMIMGGDGPPSTVWAQVSTEQTEQYFKGDAQILSYTYASVRQIEEYARFEHLFGWFGAHVALMLARILPITCATYRPC